jgi:hypothetical protein
LTQWRGFAAHGMNQLESVEERRKSSVEVWRQQSRIFRFTQNAPMKRVFEIQYPTHHRQSYHNDINLNAKLLIQTKFLLFCFQVSRYFRSSSFYFESRHFCRCIQEMSSQLYYSIGFLLQATLYQSRYDIAIKFSPLQKPKNAFCCNMQRNINATLSSQLELLHSAREKSLCTWMFEIYNLREENIAKTAGKDWKCTITDHVVPPICCTK